MKTSAHPRISKSQLTARNLLAFLIGTRCEGYTRKRAAAAITASIRTTDRALSLLIEIGALSRERGGRKTSSKLSVLMNLDSLLAHYQKMAHYPKILAHQTSETAHQDGAYDLRKNYKERKPPSMERRQTQNLHGDQFDAARGISPAELEAFLAEHERERRAERAERIA